MRRVKIGPYNQNRMATVDETARRLSEIEPLTVSRDALLSQHTRFGIGGPASILVEAPDTRSFVAALQIARSSGHDYVVIGGGTNLIVSDDGFRGIVLKLTASAITIEAATVTADAGVVLQDLVDSTIDHGLQGLETMTGIPGFTGAAVYGNAGAYGHSISERVTSVEFYDGIEVRRIDNAACQFHYRESIFKKRKDWIIFSADLAMTPADSAVLRATADKILAVRNAKYPPTMKCAGVSSRTSCWPNCRKKWRPRCQGPRSSKARFRPHGSWSRSEPRACAKAASTWPTTTPTSSTT